MAVVQVSISGSSLDQAKAIAEKMKQLKDTLREKMTTQIFVQTDVIATRTGEIAGRLDETGTFVSSFAIGMRSD